MFWVWVVVVPFVALAVAIPILGWVFASRFAAQTAAAMDDVRGAPASRSAASELPPLVANYLARVGMLHERGMRWSRIEQRGEMRMGLDGPWQPFSAVQYYAVAESAFVWKARFKRFRVVDRVVGGIGQLEARLWGFPVVKAPSRKLTQESVTRAQLLRYLAEVMWVPGAISHNPGIAWRQVSESDNGGGVVIAVLEVDGMRVELEFAFDSDGDVSRVQGLRECSLNGRVFEAPWVGFYSNYAEVDGVRIPTRAEVQWDLDTGPFVYWRGRVTSFAQD